MSFLKPSVIFQDTNCLYFISSNITYFWKKYPIRNIPCEFSDFPLFELKFTKLFIIFFKQKVSFSSKFGSLFKVMGDNSSRIKIYQPRASFSSNFASLISVMRDHSSVPFHLKLYMLLTKGTHQSANFQTFNCLHEN